MNECPAWPLWCRITAVTGMAKHEILGYFEHRRDGAWVCVRPFTLTTKSANVDIRQGMRFDYGKRVGGLDLAEYLEQLGSQFGS